MPSVEEVLASLDLIESRLGVDDLEADELAADVAALDAALREAAPGWSGDEGQRVLYRVDEVLHGAMQRRAEIVAALEQHGSSRRAAARYTASAST